MPAPLKTSVFVGAGELRGPFLVVDPGARCGIAMVGADGAMRLNTAALDELADALGLALTDAAFVVCEDFHLVGGRALQQSGSSMPSAQGIGMCRLACEWTDKALFLAPPICKRAGHKALNAAGRAAYESARNDHERDAADIAGFVLRELRRTA